jgi:hypothetical protein
MTVVGLASLGPDPLTDGLLDSIRETAVALGHETKTVVDPADEAAVDVLLTVGYPASYGRFLDAPRQARRIAWFGEPLPRPASPGTSARPWTTRIVGSGLQLAKRGGGRMTRRWLPGPLGRIREAALIRTERTANLSDAISCSRAVDRIVVTSRDRARVLAEHGVSATVVPFGYHRAGAGPIVPPDREGRDIVVAALGSGVDERRFRRGRLLADLERTLAAIGPLQRLDGVWGAERDAILARTRVIVDIHRIPGNFTGLRFLTAIAAGAVLVTEPLDDPHPFVPGVDHIAVRIDDLPAAVAALVADEPKRLQIAASGQLRLVGDLSMRASLERVLAA